MKFKRSTELDSLILQIKNDKKVLNSLDYDQLVLLTNYLIGLNRDLNNRKGENNE